MSSVYNVSIHLGPIDFMPSTIEAEVIQNIRTLLTTPRGSIPMARDFGVAFPLDDPTPRAQQILNVEIFEAIEKHEPRARVVKVNWKANTEGRLEPTVQIRIKDV